MSFATNVFIILVFAIFIPTGQCACGDADHTEIAVTKAGACTSAAEGTTSNYETTVPAVTATDCKIYAKTELLRSIVKTFSVATPFNYAMCAFLYAQTKIKADGEKEIKQLYGEKACENNCLSNFAVEKCKANCFQGDRANKTIYGDIVVKTGTEAEKLNFCLKEPKPITIPDTYYTPEICKTKAPEIYTEKNCEEQCFIGKNPNNTVKTGSKKDYCKKPPTGCPNIDFYNINDCEKNCFNGSKAWGETGDKKTFCAKDPKGCVDPPKPTPTLTECYGQFMITCDPNLITKANKQYADSIKGKNQAEIKKIEEAQDKKLKSNVEKVKKKVCNLQYGEFMSTPPPGSEETTQPGNSLGPGQTTPAHPGDKGSNNCTLDECKQAHPNLCKGKGNYIQVNWTRFFIWICSAVWFLKVD